MRAASPLVALALALAAAGPVRAADGPARLVLSFGHDRGDADQVPLRFAEREARRFAELMVELGSVPADGVELLTGPSAAEVEEALRRTSLQVHTLRETGRRVEVFVYVTGHSRGGKLSLGGEPVPLTGLRGALESMGADVTVIFLDTCTAGTAVRRKGMQPAAGYTVEVEARGPEALVGQVLVTSSGFTESAFESDAVGGSLFAHNLWSGLRGAADADGDARVTLDEIYAYLYARTLADALDEAGAPQHPHLDADLRGAGSLVLTEIGGAGAVLELVPAALGEIWIVDEGRDLAVAELPADEADAVQLALAPGSYLVYSRRGGVARVVRVRLAERDRVSLDPGGGRVASVTPVRTYGGSLLPARVEVGAGFRAGTFAGHQPAWTAAGWLGVDVQLSRLLRIGASLQGGGGSYRARDIDVLQAEIALDGGVWFSPAARVQPLLGVRAGPALLLQSPRWTEGPDGVDGGWYDVEPPALAEARGLGVRVLGDGGVILRPGGPVSLRLGISGGSLLLPTAEGWVALPRIEAWAGVGLAP